MTAVYRIELFRGQNRQWYWRIRARNGRVLASSEGYTRRASAEQAAGRLASNMRSVQVAEVRS